MITNHCKRDVGVIESQGFVDERLRHAGQMMGDVQRKGFVGHLELVVLPSFEARFLTVSLMEQVGEIPIIRPHVQGTGQGSGIESVELDDVTDSLTHPVTDASAIQAIEPSVDLKNLLALSHEFRVEAIQIDNGRFGQHSPRSGIPRVGSE